MIEERGERGERGGRVEGGERRKEERDEREEGIEVGKRQSEWSCQIAERRRKRSDCIQEKNRYRRNAEN